MWGAGVVTVNPFAVEAMDAMACTFSEKKATNAPLTPVTVRIPW